MQISIIGRSDGGRRGGGQVVGVVAEVVQPDCSPSGPVGGAKRKVSNGVSGGSRRAAQIKVFSLPLEDGGVGRVAVAGRKSGAGVPRGNGYRSRRCIYCIDRPLRRVFRSAQIFFDDYFVAQIQAGCRGG